MLEMANYNRKEFPTLVTCVMKDMPFCMEGHWKLTGVGNLDDVSGHLSRDNVAEVQDVLWQMDSETVSSISLLITFKPGRLPFPK